MNQDGLNPAASVESLRSWLIAWLAGEQGVEHAAIDPSQSFLSYGLDSVQAMSLVGDLEAKLGRRLPPTLAWDYPTIDALAEHLGSGPDVTPRVAVEGLLAGIDREVGGLVTQ